MRRKRRRLLGQIGCAAAAENHDVNFVFPEQNVLCSDNRYLFCENLHRSRIPARKNPGGERKIRVLPDGCFTPRPRFPYPKIPILMLIFSTSQNFLLRDYLMENIPAEPQKTERSALKPAKNTKLVRNFFTFCAGIYLTSRRTQRFLCAIIAQFCEREIPPFAQKNAQNAVEKIPHSCNN